MSEVMDMNWRKWKPYILWILLTEAVGVLSGLLTRDGAAWFQEFAAKPPLTPPSWVFPVVWAILFGLMGISAARIWENPESKARSCALNLFVIQLTLNFFWPLIFFNARAYGLAAIWIIALWLAVLLMILKFRHVDLAAAWLQVPYLMWLTFASYLALAVWVYNS